MANMKLYSLFSIYILNLCIYLDTEPPAFPETVFYTFYLIQFPEYFLRDYYYLFHLTNEGMVACGS